MTTILADFRLGVMVADSSISDGDRVWSGRKVFRHKGELIGIAGTCEAITLFMKWWKAGAKGKHPGGFASSYALVMTQDGLWGFTGCQERERIVKGIESIGSGAKAAMCAYEALAWTDPKLAVQIVCKNDNGSRPPVRVYKL